jgi:hypothetical protein
MDMIVDLIDQLIKARIKQCLEHGTLRDEGVIGVESGHIKVKLAHLLNENVETK